ncbi:MAG: glutaminyl-peptide cyclotransferase [Bacteroidales bacterium]|nr:glutaminyl-peptide cyclotransferase [Bacteroidales bacterium]
MKSVKVMMSVLITAMIIAVACNGGKSSETGTVGNMPVPTAIPAPDLIELVSPASGAKFTLGETVLLDIQRVGDRKPDSVSVWFNGIYEGTITTLTDEFSLRTGSAMPGSAAVKLMAYSGEERPQTVTRLITMLSDIVPPVYGYRIVNRFPHDREAYTQGLLVYNGYFYESTGQNGESGIRHVEIETGRVIKQHSLERKYFGEGLALLGDRLYQLTWTTNTGFVYDVETFSLLGTIHYNTQGWGLAAYGDRLVMSDGTNKLFFLEPDYFTVTSSVEVFDNREAVWQLNELEYINGELWANIYQTDRLARIDPSSGKVLSYVDLKGLLNDRDRKSDTDYLNGIAWDSENERLYVTGKNWPFVYEIEIVSR